MNLPLPPSEAEDEAKIEAGRILFAQSCKFFFGAQKLEQIPPAISSEIAFAGRSNVGKSSLINALTGHHGLARASNQPGRTQQLNFFNLGDRLTLVDMPGYGYAQAGKAIKRDWQALMFAYLRGRPELLRVVLLLDSRIEIKESDRAVMDLLDRAAVTYQIVLTKTDGIKPPALERKIAEVLTLARKHAAAYPDVLATSAQHGIGIDVLRARLAGLLT